MEPLAKKSNGRIALYLLLLVVAIGFMVSLRRCDAAAPRQLPVADVDTLKVAMQFAPGSFYADSVGHFAGADYDAIRALNRPFKIYPVNSAVSAAKGLSEGRYDIVVGDVVSVAPNCTVIYPTDTVRCKPWLLHAADAKLLFPHRNHN